MNNDITTYMTRLRTADREDDALFHDLLVRGVEMLHLTDRDIAHEFSVSRPTVTRWKTGISAPHPAMRKHVFAWLEKRALEAGQRP